MTDLLGLFGCGVYVSMPFFTRRASKSGKKTTDHIMTYLIDSIRTLPYLTKIMKFTIIGRKKGSPSGDPI